MSDHDAIAKRAYELYLERGSVPGYEVEDWLAAEAELTAATVNAAAAASDGTEDTATDSANAPAASAVRIAENPHRRPDARFGPDRHGARCFPATDGACNVNGSLQLYPIGIAWVEKSRSSQARDLEAGIPEESLAPARPFSDTPAASRVARRASGRVFALGATCSHYGGPLAEGLLVGDTVRCPWHHACFSLRTGEALRAPALNPSPATHVETRGRCGRGRKAGAGARRGHVGHWHDRHRRRAAPRATAAAEMLRREGYGGTLTLIGADESPPRDRPEPLQGLPGRQRRPKNGSRSARPSSFSEQNIELFAERARDRRRR